MAETNIESLIRSLVTPLLKHPQALSITQHSDGRYHRYIIDTDPSDVGRLIGRQGHVAAALRTVVEGSQSRRANSKRVRLLINDHRH
ncbi:KH domain-containing protein [Limosilactobacillus sp. STM2_1]|uniref:RNA-binding protein KhpA n=1 Tax=Limosilactobacillus rudii TaxID=2759755 RepID=A0A7W3UJG2_9LACO|nr:KH domain-containing protein [Limosilactobacillus rudii]MBB1080186.1 KH domain-containing protein [Limosilactobacillus rudii]MBB1096701.1 KH domain-containing protein [Limosilactobacillus rudii]MCD7133674.1 KH domain-containing protein [Limosilactobacillus rudii]